MGYAMHTSRTSRVLFTGVLVEPPHPFLDLLSITDTALPLPPLHYPPYPCPLGRCTVSVEGRGMLLDTVQSTIYVYECDIVHTIGSDT